MKISIFLIATIFSSTISSISAGSRTSSRLRSRKVQEENDNCIPSNQISSSIIDNPLTKCTSNEECNNKLCRLFTVNEDQFLDCDEGNNFEGLGWPTLCDDDSSDSIEISSDESLDSSEGSSVVDNSLSESVDDSTDNTDGDENTTDVNNGVPVRSDCIETDSTDYEIALESDLTQCVTNNDCSVGPCRLAVVANSETKWLFCDEGNNFDFWLPVCNEQEVPIRQPDEEDSIDIIDDSSGFCFPGTARVTVLNKGNIPMSQLQLGDSVLVDTKGTYESVYTFGHYYPDSPKSPFMRIRTEEGSELTLSFTHMVKTVNSGTAIPAVQLKKGDSLWNASGKVELVASAKKIELQQGMYAPFTASGYLVVDNIVVSNYVTLQEEGSSFLQVAGKSIVVTHQWIAHAFNAPHRMYCRYVTACTTERYNEEGMSQFVAIPFAISKWMLQQQNTIIMGLYSVLIVALCGFFSITEQYFRLFVVGTCAFLFWEISTKMRELSMKKKLKES